MDNYEEERHKRYKENMELKKRFSEKLKIDGTANYANISWTPSDEVINNALKKIKKNDNTN